MLTKTTRPELWLSLLWALLLIFGLSGCDGDDGNDGADGAPGRDATVSSTAVGSNEILATITGVSVSSPPVVDFAVTTKPDASIRNTGVEGLTESQFRFYMVRLDNGAAAGDSTQWVTYYPARFSSDTGGNFVDNGDGTYRYTFGLDITQEPGYNPAATHRLVIEIRDVEAADGTAVILNPHLDFRPDGGALTLTRDIAEVQDNCNGCHGVLKFHSGGKYTVEACTVCHAPVGSGQTSGEDSDFKRMLHKIHVNAFVEQNLPTAPLRGGVVIHPQDSRNCTTCHDDSNAATPDAVNWFNVPNQESCSACHDGPHCPGSDPTVGPGFCGDPIGHMSNFDNSACSSCHTPQSAAPGASPGGIPESHGLPLQDEALKFAWEINSIDAGTPGSTAPTMNFFLRNPIDNTLYDLTEPAFNSSATRMAATFAWITNDYTNEGSGSETPGFRPGSPAQPYSVNILGLTPEADGSFNVSAPASLPTGTAGTMTATIEGHPAADVDGDGDFTDEVPATNVHDFAAIGGATLEARRDIVNIDSCNACHQQLSLHGNNRTDDIGTCVTCHNPSATDFRARRENFNNVGTPFPGFGDGKDQETVDFKYMVHAIHRANTFLYGFGGGEHPYGDVAYPSPQLANCLACHEEDTYYPVESFDGTSGVIATAIASSADGVNPDDPTVTDTPSSDQSQYLRITPNTAVCASCHVPADERDDPDSTNMAKAHMIQNGGAFGITQNLTTGAYSTGALETCDVCHGEGRSADVGVAHGVK